MKALAIALALLCGGAALAYGGDPLPPAQEERAEAVGRQLRCAVCQGMSVTASPSETARAQLDKIRELIKQGKSDQEIRQYFIDRYGEWILLEPPRQGFAWVVWLLPAAVVLGGFGVVMRVVSKPAVAAGGPDPKPPEPPADVQGEAVDPYLARVRAEIEK